MTAAESEPAAAATQAEKPEEVFILGRQSRIEALLPESTTSGGKLELDARDTVQTVQVIPSLVFSERGVSTINEAVETAVGVQAISGYGGMDSAGIISRGFANDWVLRNGFRLFRFGVPVDPVSLDRLEVLKGPASLLAGQVDPGGTLNLLSKRPSSERVLEGELAFGSDSFYRSEIAVGGALPGTSEQLLLRLDGAFEHSGSHRDFAAQRKVGLAPALSWQVNERARLDVELDYLWNRFDFERGLPPHPTTFEVPASRSLSNPRLPHSRSDSWALFETFTYELGDGTWEIRQALAALRNENDIQEIAAFDYADDFGNVDLYRSHSVEANDSYTAQLELRGSFELGGREHASVIGVEYSYYLFDYDFFTPPTGFGAIPGFAINVFSPDYGYAIPAVDTHAFGSDYGADGYSIYFDQQLELPANLKLLVGGRFDWVKTFYEDHLSGSAVYEPTTQFRFSPRAGVVWTPFEPTDFFFSYATSFKPNPFGIDEDGELFDPETGEQLELGVRHEPLPGRLRGQLALYRIVKKNVVTYELPAFTPRLSGERRARGIELELVGSPLDGWELTLGYAYGETKITRDEDPASQGSRLFGAPEHQVSLWTTYELQDGPLRGLRFGYGLFHLGDRLASEPYGVALPSHVRHDLMGSYAFGRWELQVNVENLSDERIYATHGYNVYPQAGVGGRGTLRLRF